MAVSPSSSALAGPTFDCRQKSMQTFTWIRLAKPILDFDVQTILCRPDIFELKVNIAPQALVTLER